jgi:hypothetical protein
MNKVFINSAKLLKERIEVLEAEKKEISDTKDWDNRLDRWKECNEESKACKHELDLITLLESVEPSDHDLMTLVHDQRNATDNFNWQIKKIKDWLSDNTKKISDTMPEISMSVLFVCLEYLTTRRKELMDALDAYYVKEKSRKLQKNKE